jgi:rRNA maturation RNase YbeY
MFYRARHDVPDAKWRETRRIYMANELLNSFIDASSRYNHIVFDSRTQRFERAGLRHAIATFFGSAEATAKNKATLDAIKIFVAEEQIEEFGHSEKREYTYLAVHGLLHLFGYDHMTDEDKAEMRAIEKRVLKKLKLGDEE